MRERIWVLILILFTLILIMVAVGLLVFHYYFGLTWIDAFFNAAITTSTLGLETIERTNGQKVFIAVYAIVSGIFSTSVTGTIIGYILTSYLELK